MFVFVVVMLFLRHVVQRHVIRSFLLAPERVHNSHFIQLCNATLQMGTNYLSQTLVNTQTPYAFGTLDLGGASTQITFRPMHDVLSNYFPLRIGRNRLRLCR
jgi:hypothetical protein